MKIVYFAIALCLILLLFQPVNAGVAQLAWSKTIGYCVTAIDTNSIGSALYVGLGNGSIFAYDTAGNVTWANVTNSTATNRAIKKIVADGAGDIAWISMANETGYISNTGTVAGIVRGTMTNISDVAIMGDGSKYATTELSPPSLKLRYQNGTPYLYNTTFTGAMWSKIGYDPNGEWVVTASQSSNVLYFWNISAWTGWEEFNPTHVAKNASQIFLDIFPYRQNISVEGSGSKGLTFHQTTNITYLQKLNNSYYEYNPANTGNYFYWTRSGYLNESQIGILNLSWINNSNYYVVLKPGYTNYTIYYGQTYTSSIINLDWVTNGTLYYETFTCSTTWNVPFRVTSVNVLAVGGGGGGNGEGGAGGGVNETSSAVIVPVNGSVSVIVGNGGNEAGGEESSFTSNVTGGGGARGAGTGAQLPSGFPTIHYNGSWCSRGLAGPGGGGAGVNGDPSVNNGGGGCNGGTGGNGLLSTFNGSSLYFAAGGGGRSESDLRSGPGAANPLGGGGAGGRSGGTPAAGNGINGTGGGGGADGGIGGTGIVMIKYNVSYPSYYYGTTPTASYLFTQQSQQSAITINQTSSKAYVGNILGISVPATGGLASIITDTIFYQQYFSSTGFGITYNATLLSGGPALFAGTPYTVASSNSGASSIEGRGAYGNIYDSGGVAKASALTGGTIRSADVSISSGIFAAFGGDEGKVYMLSREGSANWYSYFTGTADTPINAVAVAWDGSSVTVGRFGGTLEYYLTNVTIPVTPTPAPNAEVTVYAFKDGANYQSQPVTIYSSASSPYSWVPLEVVYTDGLGKLTYTTAPGTYYKFVVNNVAGTEHGEGEQIWQSNAASTTVYIYVLSPATPYEWNAYYTKSTSNVTVVYTDSIIATNVMVTIRDLKTNLDVMTRSFPSTSNFILEYHDVSGIGSYQVSIVINRQGISLRDQRMVSSPNTYGISFPIDDYIKWAIATIILMVVAGLFSYSHSKRGALAVVIIAVIMMLIGMLPWSMTVVASLAAIFAVMSLFSSRVQ